MARSKIEVDMKSLNDILVTIDKMNDLTQKQVNAAARAGAKLVQRKAKEKVPESVDGSHGKPKGYLKRNIKIKAEKTKTRGKKVYTIGIGGEAYYGVFVEYGTKKHSAKPFLRQAVDENRNELTRMVLGEIAKGVDKVK